MSGLTPEQLALKEEIEKMSILIGCVASVIIVVIVWLVFHNKTPYLVYVFMVLAGWGTFLLAKKIYTKKKTADVQCKSCGTDYSVAISNRDETFLSAIPKRREQITGRSESGPHSGHNIVTVSTWTEEKYKVIDTYTCNSCRHSYTRQYLKTVKTGYHSDTFR